MNINKPRVNISVMAAIVLALVGGLLVAYLTYHLHVTPSSNPVDEMHSTFVQ
jgi:hypothetical protein